MDKKIYFFLLLIITIGLSNQTLASNNNKPENYLDNALNEKTAKPPEPTAQAVLQPSSKPTAPAVFPTLKIPDAPPPMATIAPITLAAPASQTAVPQDLGPSNLEKDKADKLKRAKLVDAMMDLDYNIKTPPKQLYDRLETTDNKHLPPVYFKSYYLSLVFRAAKDDNINDLHAALSKYDFLNGQNKDGDTVLMYAIQNYSMNVARVLLAKGAYVNAVNNRKRTALHYAATIGDITLIKLLLTMGADVTMKDDRGMSASDYAKINNNHDAALLISTFE